MRKFLALSFISIVALVIGTPSFAQSAANFCSGKQLTFIVGSSPGGGYDPGTKNPSGQSRCASAEIKGRSRILDWQGRSQALVDFVF